MDMEKQTSFPKFSHQRTESHFLWNFGLRASNGHLTKDETRKLLGS